MDQTTFYSSGGELHLVYLSFKLVCDDMYRLRESKVSEKSFTSF